MVNTCLNQTKYKKYMSEIDQVSSECSNSAHCVVEFAIYSKSDQIVIYEEMLIVDDIALMGNLGGLLGLFVGFSVFGYASILVDLILEKIKPGVLSLRPRTGGYFQHSGSNPIGMDSGIRAGARPDSSGSWSITIST